MDILRVSMPLQRTDCKAISGLIAWVQAVSVQSRSRRCPAPCSYCLPRWDVRRSQNERSSGLVLSAELPFVGRPPRYPSMGAPNRSDISFRAKKSSRCFHPSEFHGGSTHTDARLDPKTLKRSRIRRRDLPRFPSFFLSAPRTIPMPPSILFLFHRGGI